MWFNLVCIKTIVIKDFNFCLNINVSVQYLYKLKNTIKKAITINNISQNNI
ncbi:hypothetical protein UT300005_07560 [Clostridium sp. CTA-5]